MYLLPLGEHRFLCEWTRFSRTHGECSEIEEDLRGWLDEQGCTEGMIGRRESGSLPMSIATPDTLGSSRIFPAGTLGGSMRASTGYAFHSIQRWANLCTDSLAAGGPPVPPAQNAGLNFLDEVFLAAIQDRSTAAQTVFTSLFERSDPDALVRFLSGVPQYNDILPVMLSLPWMDFSKAAFKTLLRRGLA
jgi:lycopene beta-cyclase